MRFTKILLPLTFLAAVAVAACGGSKSPGGTGAACGTTGGFGAANSTCGSCVQSSCSAEASNAFGSGWASGDFSGGSCAAYLECAAGCACDQQCILGCAPDATCQSALMAFGSCEETKCSTACSSHGSTSSSSSGTGSGNTTVACYNASQFQCVATPVPSFEAAAVQMECTQQGGATSTTCPSAGVLGCCTIGMTEICYYQGGSTDAASAQMGCTQGGGTWSATP